MQLFGRIDCVWIRAVAGWVDVHMLQVWNLRVLSPTKRSGVSVGVGREPDRAETKGRSSM